MNAACNRVIEAEPVDPRRIPGGVRGMGQGTTSGGYTYYSPGGTTVSINLPGPGGGIQETIREWLAMDSLVAGIPNGWLVAAGVGLWLFGRRR